MMCGKLSLLMFVTLLQVLTLCLANYQYDFQIPGDCPKQCSCLKYNDMWGVFCNNTGLTQVPTTFPANTQLIDLTGNAIEHVSRDAFSGLMNVEELDMGSCGLQSGVIKPGALELPNLKTVELSFNTYTEIPDILPRMITKVWLYGNKITHLKKRDFLTYRSLEYLDVSTNQISTIESGTFDGLTNLSTIYMPFNKLTDSSFPANLFSNLPNLQLLGLRFNQLQHVLQDLSTSLQDLDYVGNDIQVLKSYGFQALPNLVTLAFWQGKVTTIEDNAFYGLSKLTILDFMQDKISSTITKDTFNGLTGLKTLYMDLNNVSRIEPGAFRSFASITSLWLGSNQLSTLDPEVLDDKFIPHLSELYIDDNPWYCDCHLRWLREKMDTASYIQDSGLLTCAGPSKVAGKAWNALKPSDFVTTIEDNAFYGLSKLTILDFMQDKISSTITKETFNGLTGLKTLYMDLNNVSRIEPGAFRSFASITSLWFGSNQLSTLDPEVLDFTFIPHLSELYIDDNPWYCDCHLRWLRENMDNASYIQDPHLITCAGPSKVAGKAWDVLKPSDFIETIEDNAFHGLGSVGVIDFSQNQITSTITINTFLGLTSLGELTLVINNISKIEPDAFRSLPSLSTLWLAGNHLSTLDPEVLNTVYIPHLSTLYIWDNPWYCDCHLRWLREKADNATYTVDAPHLIECAGPSKIAGKPCDVLKPEDFV